MGNLTCKFFGPGLLLCLIAGVAKADPVTDSLLINDINVARTQLEAHVPKYPTNELARLADVLGRSNNVARALQQAVMRDDVTNAAALFETFPGTANDINFSNEPLLLFVAPRDDTNMLEILLRHKADPNAAGSNGETALFRAIQGGRFDAALMLLDAGADALRTNFQGASALSLAVRANPGSFQTGAAEKLIRKLLDSGADPFALLDNQGRASILEQSLRNMNPALSDLLLTNRPSPDRRTPQGDTALHLAVEWNHTNAVDYLLANGFSIDQTNADGLTPLQAVAQGAIGYRPVPAGFFRGPRSARVTTYPMSSMMFAPGGQLEKLKADWLLKHGARLDVWSAAALALTNELAGMLATNPPLANALDGLGRSPLHYAALASEIDCAKILIRAGSDLALRTTKPIRSLPSPFGNESASIPPGSTAVHLACFRDSGAMLQLLLRSGTTAEAADDAGNQPLHIAANSWQFSPQTVCAGLLINLPVPLDATNRNGKTPLCLAVEGGRDGVAALLLAVGVRQDIGLVTNSLLHIAAAQGNPSIISNLLAHDHRVDERDAGGSTPFIYAAAAHQSMAMKFLLGHGADINAADVRGDTALHQVCTRQFDMLGFFIDLPWLKRLEQKWIAQPGFRRGTVTTLMRWKILSPLPAMTWTNQSLAIWLLEHKANPNLANQNGQTPLHLLLGQSWMIYNPQQLTNRLAALLKAGARPDTKDSQGRTPIHLAAMLPSSAALSLLAPLSRNLDSLIDSDGRTPLHLAAASFKEGYQPNPGTNVAILLALGASPNVRDKLGLTPLHLAVTNRFDRRIAVINLLLEHHADPNAHDSLGRTPLHLLGKAVRSGDYFFRAQESIEALIQAGCDPALLDNDGQTILHRWCDQGNMHSGNIDQILREFLAKHPNLVDITNAQGDTPLHVAARSRDFGAAQTLMRHGADPALRNANGETAYYLATKSAYGGLSNQIRPKGTTFGFSNTINTRNQREFDLWLAADPNLAKITFDNGQTPLLLATQPGVPRFFADRLLALGAPLEPLTALRLGRMAEFHKLARATNALTLAVLTEAIRLGRFEEIEDVASASGELRASDSEGHTLLHYVQVGHPNITDWLREHGVKQTVFDAAAAGDTIFLNSVLETNRARASATNSEGQSLLMLAARHGQNDSARILVAYGADLETAVRGCTALTFACARGDSDIAETLLNAGANPEVRQQNGLTPLHLAAIGGHARIVQVLLAHGVNPDQIQTNHTDNLPTLSDGSTPLHWAADWGRIDIVKILLQHGANVHLANQAGDTPLDAVPAEFRGSPAWYSAPPRGAYASRPSNLPAAWREIETLLLQAGTVRKKS